MKTKRLPSAFPHSSLESLEPRIAPAALIAAGGHKATYTDLDGDLVTVKITHGTLTPANFTLSSTGAVVAGGERLAALTLDGTFSGSDVSIVAQPQSGHGDGFANVGGLNAPGVDLGSVTIDGDLNTVVLGAGKAKGFALKALTTQTIGSLVFEQNSSALSFLNGNVGTLHVLGSVHGAQIQINTAAKTATLGQLIVGGSVVTGYLVADHGIGQVRIGGDLTSTYGISVIATNQGALGDVAIRGAVNGGDIYAGDRIGRITIGRDLIGGKGADMGSINAGPGGIGSVSIRGSLLGGTAQNTAAITTTGRLGAVSIGGDVSGLSTTIFQPTIAATGQLAPATAAEAVAIKSVSVHGDFRRATIAAGVDTNPDAGIGSIHIGGEFYCGHIAAGTKSGPDTFIGTADDTLPGGGSAGVASRIASLVIGGHAEGTYAAIFGSDSYRVIAKTIGKFSLGGQAQKLAAGAATVALGTTNDVFLVKAK